MGAIANAASKVKPKIDLTGDFVGFTCGRMSESRENKGAAANGGRGGGDAPTASQRREARLAQALRTNLRRRKAAPGEASASDRESLTGSTDD